MAWNPEIRTVHRRPCLLRSLVENNVDAPEGRRNGTSLPHSISFSGGSGPPDLRTITIDTPARVCPRSTGLHKGGFNTQRGHEQQKKEDQIRTLQALGVHNVFDLDIIPKHKSRGAERMRRTKVEELQGVPLAGRGADIAILGGRRLHQRSRDVLDSEGKTESNSASTTQRRHFSAPPASSSALQRSYSDHSIRAEGYATLIGRPEGTGKRSPRSARERPAFKTDPRNKEFSSTPLLDISADSAGSLAVPADYLSGDSSLQPAALISQLREATRNMPTEAVWDAMLNALSDVPVPCSDEASLPVPSNTKTAADAFAAVAAVASSPLKRGNRLSTPAKGRTRKEESLSPGRGRESFGRDTTEVSVLSASTAADTEDRRISTGMSSPAASRESFGSAPCNDSRDASVQGRQRQQRFRRDCTTWLRQEQWKAQRRAAWVS